MEYVVVQRSFEEPADFAELQAREDANAWCLDTYNVKFVRTYFAKDRRHMVCVYRAPDAEAVRTTQRTGGLPFERVWTAHSLEYFSLADAPQPEIVVAERAFPQGITVDTAKETAEGSQWCKDVYNITGPTTLMSRDGHYVVCLYKAPDAEVVRTANRKNKVPYERIWSATVHEPE
jgi:hypothetical protein